MSKRCSYSKMADLNQCNSNQPKYLNKKVFKVPDALNDPYNPSSYYLNINETIEKNLGIKEHFVPLDFGEETGGVKKVEQALVNQQALQNQIIQIHKQEAIQQAKAESDKKNKLQKLKLIQHLQNISNKQERQASDLIASEINELSQSINYD